MPRVEAATVYLPRPADGKNRFDRTRRMVHARYPSVRPDETGDQRRSANPTPRFRTSRAARLAPGVVVEWQGARFRVTNVRPIPRSFGTKVWLDTELYAGPVWYFEPVTADGEPVTVDGEPVGAFARAA